MSPWTRWPLTARGTGAALLAALCFVLAHQFGIPELLYLSLLLALGVGASIGTLYFVRSTERVSRPASYVAAGRPRARNVPPAPVSAGPASSAYAASLASSVIST